MERYVSDLFVCTYIRRWMEIKFVEMTKNVRIAFVVTHLFLKETFFRYMNITSLTGYSFLLAIPGGFGGFLLLLHYSPLSFWMRFSSMFAPTWYECIIVLMNLSTESTDISNAFTTYMSCLLFYTSTQLFLIVVVDSSIKIKKYIYMSMHQATETF